MLRWITPEVIDRAVIALSLGLDRLPPPWWTRCGCTSRRKRKPRSCSENAAMASEIAAGVAPGTAQRRGTLNVPDGLRPGASDAVFGSMMIGEGGRAAGEGGRAAGLVQTERSVLGRSGDWTADRAGSGGDLECRNDCLKVWRDGCDDAMKMCSPASAHAILPGLYLGAYAAADSDHWMRVRDIRMRVRVREFSDMPAKESATARRVVAGVRDVLVDVADTNDATAALFGAMPEIWSAIDDEYGARSRHPLWPFYPLWSIKPTAAAGPQKLPLAAVPNTARELASPIREAQSGNTASLRRLRALQRQANPCRFTARDIDARRRQLTVDEKLVVHVQTHGANSEREPDRRHENDRAKSEREPDRRHENDRAGDSAWKLRHGHVLVHCTAGVSRSTTVVVSWLMRRFQWNAELALSFVRCTRRVVAPNHGFMGALRAQHLVMQAVQRWTRLVLKRVVGRFFHSRSIIVSPAAAAAAVAATGSAAAAATAAPDNPSAGGLGSIVVDYLARHPNHARTSKLATFLDRDPAM